MNTERLLRIVDNYLQVRSEMSKKERDILLEVLMQLVFPRILVGEEGLEIKES